VIDFGLVVSLIAAIGAPALLAIRWASHDDWGSSFLDDVTVPLLVGLMTGRLVTLALDDPNSIGSLSDMLVIRSGVEFWPGVAAAAGVVAWQTNRADRPPLKRLAALAPFALVGYAAYEATCVFRDGCLGPVSPVGLRPPGLQTTMLPVGLLMAAATLAGAVIVHRLQDRVRPTVLVATAVTIVAAVRSLGSVWLPQIGDGMTRQHRTSAAVLFVATGVLVLASSRRVRTVESVVPDG
jgi:prolipoprotein diacylglyceryltransferase